MWIVYSAKLLNYTISNYEKWLKDNYSNLYYDYFTEISDACVGESIMFMNGAILVPILIRISSSIKKEA